MASPIPGCAIHGAVPVPDDEIDSSRFISPPPVFPGYQGVSEIGRGGFGEVYRAEPESGGPAVAIKVGRADRLDARAALAQELAVMAAVGPPHVPAVHAEGTLGDGRPYVVMELIAAPTLAARLLPGAAPIGIAEALAITLAILRALEAVHGRGYVHRDLKPDNVFVDAAGHATLVDFGLVVREGDGVRSTDDDASDDGAAAGTAEYMAPEQCEGRLDIDARADLYAVGVMLFELVAGRPPFWGARPLVCDAHRSRRPPRLAALAEGRAVPAALEEVVARCLAKDRRERYPDVAALRAAIEAAANAGSAMEAAPPAEAPRAADRSRDGRARGDKITVGLLFFEANADAAEVQAQVVALGGQLAHSAGGRFVALFGHERGDNPARQALRAAEELLRDRLCPRFRLDLAPVSVQARPNGTKRFVSPLFARGDRYPAPTDAPGITLSPAAAAVLPDVVSGPGSEPIVRPPAPVPLDQDTTLTADVPAWPLIGRDDLVDAIVTSAQTAIFGQVPTAVSVVGDAGHGKSHAHRVCSKRLVELSIADVLELRAREPALGDVDHTLAELLRRALGLPAIPPPDGGADLLRERLGPGSADRAPVVAQALGWTASIPPDSTMGTALRTLSAAPGALRAALTVAAGDALRRRAEARPLFVVLDDAHYASDVLLAALEYAALAEHRAPIWICAFGRPGFIEEHPSWGERAGRREAHRVGPLAPEDAASLCRRLLLPVESVPDSAVQRLVERAQAVPLLLVELVRGLRRQGIVRKSPKGEAYYLATDELDLLPDLPLIEWLARGEVDALAPALREHARLIALLGAQVTVGDVEGVLRRLDGDGAELPLDARVGAQRLCAAGIVVEDRHGRLGFRHQLVREAVARATPEALRRRIHLAAAAHYRDLPSGGAEERRLAQLAYHGSAAGLTELAEPAYLELAERARARHAYTEAERLYSRALELPATAGEASRGSAYRGRGLMRYRIGRYHDALADLSCARAPAKAAGDVTAQIEILLDEATTFDWMDEYTSSEERVEEARALLPQASSPQLEAALLLGLGRSAFRFSRNEEAVALLEQAAAAAEPLGDDGYETLVIALLLLGFIHQQARGQLEHAHHALDRAIALCESHADQFHLGGAIDHRALLWGCMGEKERMIVDFDRSRTIARQLGQGSLEMVVEYNTGETLLLMDDDVAAEPHIRRALVLDRKLSGDPGRPVVALLEARLAYYRAEEHVARAVVARIRGRKDTSAGADGGSLLVPSEEIVCTMLDLAVRGAGPEEWDALEARSERFSAGQERVELIETRAVAAARRGDRAEARRHLTRAMELAAQIPNPMNARLQRRLAELEARSAGPSFRVTS